MRVLVSEVVNGNGIVGRLFWDFAGKQIALPVVKGTIKGGICGVAS